MKFRAIGRGGSYPEWLRDLNGKSGVYVIRDALDESILYVGESHTGRLYETLTRHFQSWGGPTSGPTFHRWGVDVAVIRCQPGRALKKQDALICKLHPSRNRTNPCDEVPF